MSNRWSRRGEQTEQRRAVRASLGERYLPPEPQSGGTSPIVIIILILAAFTCLFICVILMMTTFKLIFPV
jgi:hypothetical protein